MKMEFNFDRKYVKFYHNNIERDCQDLTVSKLWIGLSFTLKGETVELIDYKYD